jgi:taurine dioxygenase
MSATERTVRILPADAPVGAEISGVDLSQPLDAETFAAIDGAFAQHGVVFFRDQHLKETQLVDFTKRFGDIDKYVRDDYALPGYPEVLVVSNVQENGRNIGLVDAGTTWHSDMSYVPVPPRGSILYAREIPVADGQPLGDTLFTSTAAAYDDLPDDLKTRLDGCRTWHSYEGKHARRAAAGKSDRKPLTKAQRESLPPVEHPVIRTHPQSGRRCLFVIAGECEGLTGIADEEAAPLLEDLAERCTRPAYMYRHRWQANDVLMWDNCLVQHLAVRDYALPQRRLMWRTQIKGAETVYSD